MVKTKLKYIRYLLQEYSVLVLTSCILTAVTLGKKQKQELVSRNRNYEDDVKYWSIEKNIDFSGRLRKSFFVDSALSAPNENTVCSPLSVLMPLGKLALGAEESTLEELLRAIGIKNQSMISETFKPMIALLRYLPGGKLDIASKIYVPINSHIYKKFDDESKAIFDYSVKKINFEFPTFVAQQINSWVSLQTNGVIKDIISSADILPSTSLILINAVYFSGKWNKAFETFKNVTFYAPNSKKVLTMMSHTSEYNYTKSKGLEAEIIKIPYKGNSAEFVIVLPTSRIGLPLLLNQLKISPGILDYAMNNMLPTMIELTIPKFKIESDLNLNDMYHKIGVKQIFEKSHSQLTKIVRDESIYVTTAKHKAFIDVHEYGTEAGAASGVVGSKLANPEKITFQADHPFLFFIIVKGQQLFSGTYVNPNN